MTHPVARLLLAGSVLVAFGCAKPEPSVWVPPRIDLHELGTLGLIEFHAPPGYGPLATEQFLATVHGAQAGVPVLELGPLAEVLHAVGHDAMGPDAARAIGERYRVDVVVVGDLEMGPPKPRFALQSFTEASASAEILGTLQARILDAGSGATIWSDQARGARTVARLDLAAGQRPLMGAVDPDGEYAQLVGWLVGHVTGDFRGYWARP